jgi:hypothetical protein
MGFILLDPLLLIEMNGKTRNCTWIPPPVQNFKKMAAALSATTSLKTKVFTLVLITADNYGRVLLGMKKRGFG